MLSASFQKCEDNNSPYKRVCFTSQLANYYVIYTITVNSNLVWHCAVFNRVIDKTWTFLQSLPPTSDKNINYCATFWKNINICEGNNDVQDVIKQRLDFKVPFPSQAGNESLAYLENETMVKLDILIVLILYIHAQDFEILLSAIKWKCIYFFCKFSLNPIPTE